MIHLGASGIVVKCKKSEVELVESFVAQTQLYEHIPLASMFITGVAKAVDFEG